MDKNIKIFGIVIVVLVVGIAVAAFTRSSQAPAGPGKYDTLAQCLKDKGAIFYGAYWCPHCQAQKKLFGSSSKLLPYVECSTADARGQTSFCIEKGIKSYPTWEFADGSRLNGQVPLEQLAEKTGCSLAPSSEETSKLPAEQ